MKKTSKRKQKAKKAEQPEPIVPEMGIFTLVVDKTSGRYYTSMTGWQSNAELEGVLYSILRELVKATEYSGHLEEEGKK